MREHSSNTSARLALGSLESPRITLAHALALGVRVSWREATAIVREAIAATRATEGRGPARVTADSCLLTRGGDVVLTGTAARARPEAVVPLLDDLLASCSDPGRFAGAVADGTALEMIEELSRHTPPKRRRVEVASVALRGLVAAADAARAMADAAEQNPRANVDAITAVPASEASPAASRLWARAPLPASTFGNTQVRRPGLGHKDLIAAVEAAPAAFSMDLLGGTTQVNTIRTANDVRVTGPARFDWVKRASLAALVCAGLAAAAGGLHVLQQPATRRAAGAPAEPAEPAIEPPEIDAPVAPALLPEVADQAALPPVVARSVPPDSAQTSFARSVSLPAGTRDTPAETTATVAGSGSLPAPSAAAILAPDAATLSAVAPPSAVDLSSDVAGPGAAAASPAATLGSAATAVPKDAVAGSAVHEADARAIENVLGQYRSAFNNLDAGAASAVWPTVNEKTLAKAFERLESHDVSFERCQIEVFSALAEAACSGSARYVPKVGSRTPKLEARRWRFSLRKASAGWLIDSVDAR